ncbi:MAG TPA: hypothetical protein GX514_01020 [Thermoanaerobacterales bacterium]|uniref:hypothetical protein n=1 Tax=Tepidanaerobacter sp. GT38 TaxID=2722793 RepID=UPI0017A22491|nr:hypothetical protein [Tepidanaerobacter sp. GT38]MCG1011800.1 hypothetical protein [Tepidanaerobacter sp. GT38]HHY41425.1 hypothetical protein [Thermoanaerobacterales bacterium]
MGKNKKAKIIIVQFLLLIVVIGLSSFISYYKFSVLNPLSTARGLFQILFTEKEYVEIQKYPKVILAKPSVSLSDYMESRGFREDKENQMGALHRFINDDTAQYVVYSTNMCFSKWKWQE